MREKTKVLSIFLFIIAAWIGLSSQTTLHYPALETSNSFTNTNTFGKAIVTGINNIGNSGTSFNMDLSQGNVQQITMTGNATATVSNLVAGQVFTVLVCQNSTGGYTLTWPASFHGAMTIGSTASQCSSQEFSVNAAGTTAYATNPGIINQ